VLPVLHAGMVGESFLHRARLMFDPLLLASRPLHTFLEDPTYWPGIVATYYQYDAEQTFNAYTHAVYKQMMWGKYEP